MIPSSDARSIELRALFPSVEAWSEDDARYPRNRATNLRPVNRSRSLTPHHGVPEFSPRAPVAKPRPTYDEIAKMAAELRTQLADHERLVAEREQQLAERDRQVA